MPPINCYGKKSQRCGKKSQKSTKEYFKDGSCTASGFCAKSPADTGGNPKEWGN